MVAVIYTWAHTHQIQEKGQLGQQANNKGTTNS